MQDPLKYTLINQFLTVEEDNAFRNITKDFKQGGCLPSPTVYRDFVQNDNMFIFADKNEDCTDDECLEQDDIMYLCNLRTILDYPATLPQEVEVVPPEQYERLKKWLEHHPHAPRATPPPIEGADAPPPTFTLNVAASGRGGKIRTEMGLSTDKDLYLVELLQLRAPVFDVPLVVINIGSRHRIEPNDWSLIHEINTPNELRVEVSGAQIALPDYIHTVKTLSIRHPQANFNMSYGSSKLNVTHLPLLVPNVEVFHFDNVHTNMHLYSAEWWAQLFQAMFDKGGKVSIFTRLLVYNMEKMKGKVRAAASEIFGIEQETFHEARWDEDYREHLPEEIERELANGLQLFIRFWTNVVGETYFVVRVEQQ